MGAAFDPAAEPWLGAPEMPVGCGGYAYYGWAVPPLAWARGANDDREQDAGDEPELENEHGDTADHEPSLGAAEGQEDQRRWSAGNRRDLED